MCSPVHLLERGHHFSLSCLRSQQLKMAGTISKRYATQWKSVKHGCRDYNGFCSLLLDYWHTCRQTFQKEFLDNWWLQNKAEALVWFCLRETSLTNRFFKDLINKIPPTSFISLYFKWVFSLILVLKDSCSCKSTL